MDDDRVATLVQHFEAIHRDHMRGLPIVNTRLSVRASGFREYEGHALGVLVTPWFMNLVLLPGTDEWAASDQGEVRTFEFPSGPCDFTVAHDEAIGTYLTAVLFRTVADFPDQATAIAVADEIMTKLLVEPEPARGGERRMSRRRLITGLRGD